jgi:hypothetical protein
MFKISFFSAHAWVLLVLGALFLKIYQHNLYIKTVYDHQRLEQVAGDLEKQRNELMVGLYDQKQPLQIMGDAEKMGMVYLTLDTLIRTTENAALDFINSSSSDAQVLAEFGLVIPPGRGS